MFKKAIAAAVLATCSSLASAAATQPIEFRLMAVGGAEFAHEESSETFVGAAIGADYELDDRTFVGAEASIERTLRSSSEKEHECAPARTFGSATVRTGFVLAETNKAYVLAGVHFGSEEASAVYGAGIERKFGKLVGSLEYRRISEVNSNQIGIGVGFLF